MRRTALVLSTSALLSFAPAALSTPPADAATPTFSGRVLSLINEIRVHKHLAPLRASTCVSPFAVNWSHHLAKTRTLSHQSLGPILNTCRATIVGENVAYGNVTPSQLVRLWLDSPGHRTNILNPKYTRTAISTVRNSTDHRIYATQDFARA